MALSAFAFVASAVSAVAAPCFDVAKGEPRSLTGILSFAVFPGPPNFEDIRNGDAPEPTFVLQLSAAICIVDDDFADPNTTFRSVHVVETEATAGRLRHFVHRAVTLTLTEQMASVTGHHHAPLVAWVTSIRPAIVHP